MKIRDIISEAISQGVNSRGRPILGYDNFRRWFKNSVAVDDQGRPLVVYHGTGAVFTEFSLEHRGENKGNDQYGPGFYTATDPRAASAYADGKNPNVIPLYVSIQKPVIIGKTPPFSATIIQKLITAAPEFDDYILNFGDTNTPRGVRPVLLKAVEAYTYYEDAMQQLMTIAGDFWSGHNLSMLKLVTKLTGYDGVMVSFSDSKFFIAWRSDQLKSAISNSVYSDSSDISRE